MDIFLQFPNLPSQTWVLSSGQLCKTAQPVRVRPDQGRQEWRSVLVIEAKNVGQVLKDRSWAGSGIHKQIIHPRRNFNRLVTFDAKIAYIALSMTYIYIFPSNILSFACDVTGFSCRSHSRSWHVR